MTVLTEPRLELLRRRLAAAGIAADRQVAAAPAAPAEPGAFGVAERRMWKIYRLDPDSVSHNIPLVLEFGAGYTLDALRASLELLVRKAAVLDSVVAEDADGVPRRVPAGTEGRWAEPGAIWEWGAIPDPAEAGPAAAAGARHPGTTVDGAPLAADLAATVELFARTPFRLTEEPPLRARLIARPDGGVTLILVVHHLAVDDTSWPLLLGTLVSGVWPEQAGDAVHALAAPSVADALRHAERTWAAPGVRYPLSGALPEIGAAESWLAPMDDGDGARLARPIDPADVTALEQVARRVGATANAVLIAVCALGVYALTGAADHVLLVPADNRQPGDTPDRVGYSGNIVPMRFAVDPEASTEDALRQAVAVVYRSMEFAAVDYGAVLTALRQSGGRFPVAEIMASVRNAPLRNIPVPPGAQVSCAAVFTGIAPYPLTLAFEMGADGGVHLEVDHQLAVVDTAAAERAARVLAALVHRLPAALATPVAALAREVTA